MLGSVKPGEGVAVKLQFGCLPLEVLHAPSSYYHPFQRGRGGGRGQMEANMESQGMNSSPHECWQGTDECWLGTDDRWLGTDECWLDTHKCWLSTDEWWLPGWELANVG